MLLCDHPKSKWLSNSPIKHSGNPSRTTQWHIASVQRRQFDCSRVRIPCRNGWMENMRSVFKLTHISGEMNSAWSVEHRMGYSNKSNDYCISVHGSVTIGLVGYMHSNKNLLEHGEQAAHPSKAVSSKRKYHLKSIAYCRWPARESESREDWRHTCLSCFVSFID